MSLIITVTYIADEPRQRHQYSVYKGYTSLQNMRILFNYYCPRIVVYLKCDYLCRERYQYNLHKGH